LAVRCTLYISPEFEFEDQRSKVKEQGHQGQKRQSSGALLTGAVLGALHAVYVWENIFSIVGVAGVALCHATTSVSK